jgi:hypothetical protein
MRRTRADIHRRALAIRNNAANGNAADVVNRWSTDDIDVVHIDGGGRTHTAAGVIRNNAASGNAADVVDRGPSDNINVSGVDSGNNAAAGAFFDIGNAEAAAAAAPAATAGIDNNVSGSVAGVDDDATAAAAAVARLYKSVGVLDLDDLCSIDGVDADVAATEHILRVVAAAGDAAAVNETI